MHMFKQFQDLIYSETGIYITDTKSDFLERRIKSRMLAHDIKQLEDYWFFINYNREKQEITNLIQSIVNHESYFFREYPQLEFFVEKIIPILEHEKRETKTINLLSAGCSTGDEPYTLAIIFREMLDNFNQWTIKIDGIDISGKVLDKAVKGEYKSRSLMDTPYIYRDRYFKKVGEDYFVNDIIKGMVQFKRANLYDTKQFYMPSYYDVVFIRNVLIYFDYESGKKVLEQLYHQMTKGAFLFLGLVESVARFTHVFEMSRIGNGFVYRKE